MFVGLGLHDETGISLRGVQEIETAEKVFLELYTSILPNFSIQRFKAIVKKQIEVISRHELEEENGSIILNAAEKSKAVFLIPGDPFIATTHIALRIEAERRGIKTRIVNGASVLSAIIGLTGLHNYKFGKTVTIPFPETSAETPYNVIAQNKILGLHTMCLLDIKAEERRFLNITDALKLLLRVEQKRKEAVVTQDTLAVGVARAGSNNPDIKANFVKELIRHDFENPPQSLVFPGTLHFMEAEALVAFADAPEQIMRFAE